MNGRCETGPNVLHCIFEDKNVSSVKFCSGKFVLVRIPENNICISQRGKYKCINIEYDSEDECKVSCHQQCKGSKCLY